VLQQKRKIKKGICFDTCTLSQYFQNEQNDPQIKLIQLCTFAPITPQLFKNGPKISR